MDASFWNDCFGAPTSDFVYGTAPNKFIEREARRLPQGASVLALGAGEGRNAVFLAGQGFDVTALDYSEAGLIKTRHLATERGVRVETVQADVTSWTPKRVWDAVVIAFLHLPAPHRPALYQSIQQALRPGGLLIAEWFHPRQRAEGYESGGPPAKSMMIGPEELKKHFAPASGEALLCEVTEQALNEGTHHQGPAAVTHFIWQREESTAATGASSTSSENARQAR